MLFGISFEALILATLAIILFAVLFIKSVSRFTHFKRELIYITEEIKRTDGLERKYWLREKRRLIKAYLFFRNYP